MNPALFWILAATAVVSAVVVILKRNPLGSALALAINLVALAGIFAGLSAPFLFIIQILVYAGAVVVLIIFVIMLLSLRQEQLQEHSIQKAKFAASGLLCLGGAALLMRVVAENATGSMPALPAEASDASGAATAFGHVEAMADLLFSRYLFPFEVVSIILLVGIVGAVVVAKRGE